jgi:hypothetical protein
MNTRLCAAIGAIALVFAIGSASAFACGAGHHSAHKSTLIPLPDHFECATASSPLPNHRSPGSDSIQTDLGSV